MPVSSSQHTSLLIRVSRFFWPLFLVFSGIGLVVMPLDLGEAQARDWIVNESLRNVVIRFLSMSDAIWMVLAAVNAYFWVVASEGLRTARKWGAIILVGSAVLEWIGAKTGFPFGPYVYTDRIGLRLAGVLPFTIPLAWFIIITCSRAMVLRAFPRANSWQLALGVGTLALLTDLNLEFVAWKVRAYWIWYPDQLPTPAWPPIQNYASWFLAAMVFSLCLREDRMISPERSSWKPWIILGSMNLIFFAVHVVRWLE